MNSKRCFKCGVEKPISEFYKHPAMMDGHLNKCKNCCKQDVRQNYIKNHDYYLQYEKKRNQSPERKAKQRQYMSKTKRKLYRIWKHMKARCYDPTNPRYYCYGQRGITVCDEWRNNFEAFYIWAITNGYQEGLSIERINNDGNYEPDNCKWATQIEQANNKSCNIRIKIGDEEKNIAEWARVAGIPTSTMWARVKRGWLGEDLLKPLCKNQYDSNVKRIA
jgi:hypothetical protein